MKFTKTILAVLVGVSLGLGGTVFAVTNVSLTKDHVLQYLNYITDSFLIGGTATTTNARLSVVGSTTVTGTGMFGGELRVPNIVATSSATSSFPVMYSSTSTVSNLNGVIYVDGVRFAKTGAGIQEAINACYALRPRCTTVDLLDTTTRVDTSIEVRGGIKITSSASSTLSAFGTFTASNGIFFHQGTDATPDNVIIEKITFNIGGNATAFSNRGGDNIQFRDNFVSGTTTAAGAILFDGTRGTSATSSRFLILRNTFRNLTATSGASTIYFGQTSGKGSIFPSVSQNIFDNTGGPGVKIDELAPMYNLSVSNNTFVNQLSGNHYYDPAVMVWGGITNSSRIFDTLVTNNVYRNSINYASYTFGGGGVWLYQSKNTTVTNNIFTGAWDPVGQDDYIFVAPGRISNPSDGYVISNNIVEGVAAAWDADSMQNVVVSGNLVKNSGHCFDVGYNKQINIHIIGNTCINSFHRKYGAGLVFYNSTTLQNVVIENNKYIDMTGSTTLRGDIFLTGGVDFSNAVVKNNYFYRTGSNPSFIGKENGGEIAPLEIIFNTVEGATSINKNSQFLNSQIPFFSSTTTGSGTTTNGLLAGSSNFVWDWVNDKLGIGTSSPYEKLSVAGRIAMEAFSATSTTATSSIFNALSIGTSSAADRLHVVSASGTGMLFDRTNTTDFQSSDIRFRYGNNAFWSGFIRSTKVSGGGGSMSFGTGVAGGGSALEALHITNGQRIGIGVFAPENKLQVVGGIQTSSSASSPAGASTVLSQESGYGRLQSFGSTPLALNSAGNNVGVATSTPTNKLTVNGQSDFWGNLGIGTTSPYAKLSVVGPVVAEYFTATSTTATSTFPSAQFGTSTGNKLEITAGGDLLLRGDATVWEDLRFPVSQLSAGVTPADPCVIVGTLRTRCYDGGTSAESLEITAQMPHNWKEGSTIYPHVHWGPSGTGAGNVKWIIDYEWKNINDTFASVTTASTTDAADGTAHKHQIIGLPAITGTGKTVSSILLITLRRDPTDTQDTYAADAELYEFDIHYEIDSLGSRSEYTK